MEIRKIGFSTFRLAFNEISILTDPLLSLKAAGEKIKGEVDLILFPGKEVYGKEDILKENGIDGISSENREAITEVSSPGDYEMGGVMIRRKASWNFYVLDENNIRVVYFGEDSSAITPESVKDLGDVDVLIAPIGGAPHFHTNEELSKLISIIDPTVLLPSAFADGYKLAEPYSGVNLTENFLKFAGYTHVTEEKKLKVAKGIEDDSKVMEVVILK